jgi:uncharacterized membrane protein
MILLSYLWPLALIPLLVEKEDQEVQWHAKHGLVLFGLEIVVFIVLGALSMILGAATHGSCCFAGVLAPLFWLAAVVVHILCIVKGVNGQRFLIPGISELVDRF